MREGTASSHGPLLTRKKKKKSQVSPFFYRYVSKKQTFAKSKVLKLQH
jgi:hypothetical protein